MQSYKNIAYLLGCYMVVADREINDLEVKILDNYKSEDLSDELVSQRRLIYSDDEEKPALSSLITTLKLSNLTRQQREEIIQLLADVAFGDDYMASSEKDLLLNVAKTLNIDATVIIREAESLSKERLKSIRLSKTKRVIGKVENYAYGLFSKQKNNAIDLLLGSLGYSTSIEDITDKALVDLERVTNIVDGINTSLVMARQSLSNLKFGHLNSSKEIVNVANIVTNIKDHFDGLINISLKENHDVLEKKSRNIRYFTIAFMGRTKAGKSTLHKVITQQEDDDIGVGKLRTTRYNRSWYWNKLRIVDTPGIGAPGGATDTEIAKSVIDEADIICYVVTSDSIQETEFDFFETIKERNKPLYIILNVKSNLTQSIRLKRFLENPTAWKDSIGPQSIQGHLDRIHERLDGKYNMDAVQIIPIHLLAAQLGFSSAPSNSEAKKLQEGSNIFAFTRSVIATVHETGGIKKSLSVVDGTAYQIHSITSSLCSDLSQLKTGHNLLKGKLSKFNTLMKAERNKLISDIKNVFSGAQSELRNRAAAFANENYDRRDASNLWTNDYTVKSIHARMDARLHQRMQDFNEKIQSQIEEIADDIKLMGSFNVEYNVSGESITNTKLGAGIVGAIITGAAGFAIANIWNPAGWVVGLGTIVVGAICSFFTSLFTSKQEKIGKATEKMRTQLYSAIDNNINDNKQKYLNNLTKSLDRVSSTISALLITYIEGTEQIIKNVKTTIQECENGEFVINSLVGFRILEFIGKRMIKDNEINTIPNETLINKFPVDRDWINQSLTYKYNIKLSKKDKEKILHATQMTISNQ